MGYTTEFEGEFEVTPTLSHDDREFLTKFAGAIIVADNDVMVA